MSLRRPPEVQNHTHNPDPENRHSIYNESSLGFNSLSKLSTCEAIQDRSGHQFRFTAVTRSPRGRGSVKDMKQSHLSNFLLQVKNDNKCFQTLSSSVVLGTPKGLPTCKNPAETSMSMSYLCRKFSGWIYLQLIPKEESWRYFNQIPEPLWEADVL